MKTMIYALLLSMLVTVLVGPVCIPMLKRLKFGQSERDLGPQSHLKKAGTPTMGGMMFLAGILVSTLLFTGFANEMALPALLVTFAFALVGFLDDFLKVRKHNTDGLRAYQKIIAQFGIALILAIYAYRSPLIGSSIYLPFMDAEWDLGLFYIPFVVFVTVATVNSVNLTDGLDGLAAGTSSVYAIAMAVIFAYLQGVALMPADAGQAAMAQKAAEMSSMGAFAAAVAGGCLGFLVYNAYPARVFMGDTGSLALGGAITCMAICSRAVLLLPLMGICFVASSVSVILQVGSYKLRHGKRIFRMAPLHHHFELGGKSETQIVCMYMLVTMIMCLMCILAFA
ncbi:MAG: phospho-N-acetylmuramoyl-pentapeptide-transferase [Clostridia bacterium]|nr:phospho-N-acetylmuramoyl-pentapeptide-transferase [Clostridia bacterium]